MSAHHNLTELLPQLEAEAQRPIQRILSPDRPVLVVVVVGFDVVNEMQAMLDGVEEGWERHDRLVPGPLDETGFSAEEQALLERPFQAHP